MIGCQVLAHAIGLAARLSWAHAHEVDYMQNTSCQMLGLKEEKAGNKIVRRNIKSLRYANDTILKAESEEELKTATPVHRPQRPAGSTHSSTRGLSH